MTRQSTRIALVVLTLIAVAPRTQAQLVLDDFDVPGGYFAPISGPNTDPINDPPIGDCGIAVPAWQEALVVDCQLPGTPTALQVWKGQPVVGGTPEAILPYSGGTVTVPLPAASVVHELENGTLWLEVVGGTGTLGQGQIVPPAGQSFTRATLNGAGQVPPNPTTATGSCDLLIMQDPVGFDLTFFDCGHNVQNAQFGQLRQDGPGGPVIVDFSDQVSSPRQRGAFRSTVNRGDFLNGNVWGVIDESFVGARIAGRLGPCWSGQQADGDQALCLQDNRFRVDVDFDNGTGATGGAGNAVGAFTGGLGDSGLFWFFDPDNVEMVLKVLDGCDTPGFNSFWVFAGGLTNVEVDITVTDTLHDVTRTYSNPLNTPFQPIQDTQAFATCP